MSDVTAYKYEVIQRQRIIRDIYIHKLVHLLQKDLPNSLSEYYNSSCRLAVVENASHRPGVDPATFAMELGILAVRGFEDMGERACDLMIRNKFIAAQQSCELRRHLDGAAAQASVRDIVDSFRVRESHSEAGYSGNGGPNPKFLQTISQVAEDTQPQKVTLHKNMRQLLLMSALSPPRVAISSSDRELLIQRILEAVRPGRSVIQKRSQEMDIGRMTAG